LARSLDDAQRFDDLTNMGNVLMVTQRIWLDGCGPEGQMCRRALLKAALEYGLNPASLNASSATAQQLQTAQASSWPEQGIAHINNDLGNRNPLEQDLYSESLWTRLGAIFGPAQARQHSLDKLAAFDRLPKLPAELDPLSRRPPKQWIQAQDLDGAYALAQMLSPADWARLEGLADYDAARLQQAVMQLPADLFAAQPVVREELMLALSHALGAQPLSFVFDDGHAFSAPIVQGEPPLELAEDSILQPYAEYCFACHRGNPSADLNFMAGADEATVLANIQQRSEIREVLDFERYLGTRKEGQLMPPTDSWQREALMAAEAHAAKQGMASPIAQMRAQIPTLFDF
jgi:AcrR family transcriptional regulator